MQRKSSRGNPYHDELGRFTTAGGCKKKSERTLEGYARRTEDRVIEKHAESTGKTVEQARKDFNETVSYHLRGTGKTDIDREYARRETVEDFMSREYQEDSARLMGNDLNRRALEAVNNEAHYIVKENGDWELSISDEIQEGLIVEYAPDFCGEGEEKYVHVVKEITRNPVTGEMTRAKIATINTKLSFGSTSVVDFEMIRPASKAKVDAVNKKVIDDKFAEKATMPWQTSPKYKNEKNAQLRWLRDHPDSKYNNQEFIMGIKRIEVMADAGISAKRRKEVFVGICEKNGISVAEGIHFIDEDFLS